MQREPCRQDRRRYRRRVDLAGHRTMRRRSQSRQWAGGNNHQIDKGDLRGLRLQLRRPPHPLELRQRFWRR